MHIGRYCSIFRLVQVGVHDVHAHGLLDGEAEPGVVGLGRLRVLVGRLDAVQRVEEGWQVLEGVVT